MTCSPAGYYSQARDELLGLHRWRGGEHVLDLGCGAGGNAPYLRAQGVASITGIEPVPAVAAVAREVYDHVLLGTAEQCLQALPVRPEVVVAADVLEHTVAPDAVLRTLLAVSAPGVRLLVSAPNVRHHSVLRMLVLHGQWRYQDEGIMDRTHLRWFTRASIQELLTSSGWAVEQTRPKFNTPRQSAWNRGTFGRAEEFLGEQWLLVCGRAQPGSSD